jgi:diphthamide biosynthesis protein 7
LPLLTEQYSKVVQTAETAHGILDLHFSPHINHVFCTANSTGSISFYRICPTNDASITISKSAIHVSIPDLSSTVLVLAMQWHPHRQDLLAITLSDGSVQMVSFDATRLKEMVGSEKANTSAATSLILISFSTLLNHSLETWTLAFSLSGSSILTGSDDCVLLYTDLDTEVTQAKDIHAKRTLTEKRLHTAGITAILPLSNKVFLTGSYDDEVRVLMLEESRPGSMMPVKFKAGLNLGGGVWRLKIIGKAPSVRLIDEGLSTEFFVLVSCMYAGAKVVKITSDNGVWDIKIVSLFTEHESMNYGCDWVADGDDENLCIVISTSFYDKKVCLWRFQVKDENK